MPARKKGKKANKSKKTKSSKRLKGKPTPLIVDRLLLSYRFLAPRPFDERLFLRNIEDSFVQATNLLRYRFDQEGRGEAQPVSVYVSKKGDVELNFVPERGIIGVQGLEGPNLEEMTKYFKKIKTTLESDLGISLNKNVAFLEIVGEGRYKGKNLPLQTLNSVNTPLKKSFKKFFDNEDVATFGIRVCPQEKLENRKSFRELIDWFEIRISPMIVNPNFYFWNLVYRKSDLENVEEFWSKLQKKLVDLFRDLEKEGV